MVGLRRLWLFPAASTILPILFLLNMAAALDFIVTDFASLETAISHKNASIDVQAELVVFPRKLTLTPANGFVKVYSSTGATLSGNGSTSLFYVNGATTNAGTNVHLTLANLTITQGYAESGWATDGGVVNVYSAGMSAYDCHFHDNFGFWGGVVWCHQGSCEGDHCKCDFHTSIFSNNRAASGGGALRPYNGYAYTYDCWFDNNTAGSSGGDQVWLQAYTFSSSCSDAAWIVPTPMPSDDCRSCSGNPNCVYAYPTPVPTPVPTLVPTLVPTPVPTPMPSSVPTSKPTTPMPSPVPTSNPTIDCGDGYELDDDRVSCTPCGRCVVVGLTQVVG